MILIHLLIVGVDVGDGRVAVPFEESDIWIFSHKTIHHAKHIILNLRVAEVEHKLIAEIIFIAVGESDDPIFVLLIKLTLGVHHLRLNPETKLHAILFCSFCERTDTVGKLVFSLCPVAQTLSVAMTGILVGKPTVIEKEHIHAKLLGLADETFEFLFVEVEISCLPVVEEGHSGIVPLMNLVVACPIMEIAARFSTAFIREGEDKFGSGEGLPFL